MFEFEREIDGILYSIEIDILWGVPERKYGPIDDWHGPEANEINEIKVYEILPNGLERRLTYQEQKEFMAKYKDEVWDEVEKVA